MEKKEKKEMEIKTILEAIEKQLTLLEKEAKKIKQDNFVSCFKMENKIEAIRDYLKDIKDIWEE